MRDHFPSWLGPLMALVLIAHGVLAFTKMRWVTGLVELVGAIVLFLAARRPVVERDVVVDRTVAAPGTRDTRV